MSTRACAFCEILDRRSPAHVVLDDAVALAFLDARPLFPGHVHVVPRRKGDGLRGFFWPRHPYESTRQAAEIAERIRAVMASARP